MKLVLTLMIPILPLLSLFPSTVRDLIYLARGMDDRAKLILYPLWSLLAAIENCQFKGEIVLLIKVQLRTSKAFGLRAQQEKKLSWV